MNRLLSAFVVIFIIFLLNSCGEVDDLVDSVSGSDDESAASNENPRKDVTPTTTTPTTTTPTTTTPTTGTKTSTDPTASYPNVAGHGILWKPVSDSDKKLAVLLKSSYGVPTVNVLDANKNLIEKGRFVYKSNPDRATYRFSRSGGAFPKPCLIQVGGEIFRVPNGSNRYE
jgi:hypothetical protein